MQSLNWYYHRLKRMSLDEVFWRGRGAAREAMDLVRIPLGLHPKLDPPATFSAIETGYTVAPELHHLPADMQARLVAHADKILENKLSFFQHTDLDLGEPINWHRDWNQQLQAPVKPCPLVDYRVAEVSGDCKQVWEPNRHHQWVVLGRAYRVTGDERYAEGFWRQLDSWLQANPFGYGMAWKNPLELGVRIINWVWALDLCRGYEPDADLWKRAHRAFHQHVWDLTRKFSQGSSANNHLIGEVAGVYIAAAYFPHMPGAEDARLKARAILDAEIHNQLFDSGCTKEQALGYQFFSLQFFTHCAKVAKLIGEPFDDAYQLRLEAGYRFLTEVAEGGDELPLFGDKDDGYVLDLGDHSHDVRAVADLCRVLFDEQEYGHHESAYWLAGVPIVDQPLPEQTTELQSRAYTDAGHYFMQNGSGDQRISLQIDCAPLGYGLLTAHGHADALAFTLRLGGKHMLVDPGTFDYYTYPAWRNAFRRTINHNTVCIDGRDQSETAGPFLFTSQANAHCLEWQDDSQRSVLLGRHDGYSQKRDANDKPVNVARRYQLNKAPRTIDIEDQLGCADEHTYQAAWHFHPECKVTVDGQTVNAQRGDQRITIELPSNVKITTYHGDEEAMLGWFSEYYHRKLPCTTVIAQTTINGDCKLGFKITCH